MSYKRFRYYSTMPGGTAAAVVIPTIDVSDFDKFCITVRHENSANNVGISGISFQASVDPSIDSAGTGTAPAWFAVSTNTFVLAASLAQSAMMATTAIDNVYNFIRVLAAYSTTANAIRGQLQVTVAGFTRIK